MTRNILLIALLLWHHLSSAQVGVGTNTPDPSSLRSVSLHNSTGMLLKTWEGYQPVYILPPLPKGIYPVTIFLTNGERFTRTLIK